MGWYTALYTSPEFNPPWVHIGPSDFCFFLATEILSLVSHVVTEIWSLVGLLVMGTLSLVFLLVMGTWNPHTFLWESKIEILVFFLVEESEICTCLFLGVAPCPFLQVGQTYPPQL